MRRRWRPLLLRFILIYVVIGFSISFVENLYGLVTGGLTAFAWTGSLKDNAMLLFWWFIFPAIIWPYDLYWNFYWKVLR